MTYKLVLNNEVEITAKNIKKIFAKKKVFVLGYGSLLFAKGWNRRKMQVFVEPKHLQECKVKGYKRGTYGLANDMHFYGLIEDATTHLNGVLNPIYSMHDWISLMKTELIAGLFNDYNYRVVDVTDKIYGVVKLPKNAVIHAVVNEAKNEELVKSVGAAPGYYPYVFRGVLNERTTSFILEFLKTGGLSFDQASILKEAIPIFIE